MVDDARQELRELCGRVAEEQNPAKLKQLIAALGRLLAEKEGQKSKFPTEEKH